MKLKFSHKDKDLNSDNSFEMDVDAERVAEKLIDEHDKNWKDKFTTKHNAKKEILELKHKHNLENKEQNLKKKTFVQEIFDGINTNKELKLEEKRRIEEEKKREEEERIRKEQEEQLRVKKEKKTLGIILLVVGLIITIVGFAFGIPDSGLEMVGSLGFIISIVGIVLLVRNV